ncbi:MAG: hypothetical protein ACPGGA_05455 [Balneolaceae bacterium]
MVANVLTDFFIDDFVEGDFNQNSFMIEVSQNFVTVDRKHQHTSLIESKTIKVDKDVIVYLHEKNEDVYDLECKWLWRDATFFENLSKQQALDLQRIIIQLSNAQRRAAMLISGLKGIRVGNQIWANQNMDIDMGLESKVPIAYEKEMPELGKLYTYKAVDRIDNLYADWRVPTVKDYEDLFDFFYDQKWNELTKNMGFHLGGFFSEKIPNNELNLFIEMNPALRALNGGFYWTSDIEDYNYKDEYSGKRKYVYFNNFNEEINIEESVNSNDNLFSLRLIKKQ